MKIKSEQSFDVYPPDWQSCKSELRWVEKEIWIYYETSKTHNAPLKIDRKIEIKWFLGNFNAKGFILNKI